MKTHCLGEVLPHLVILRFKLMDDVVLMILLNPLDSQVYHCFSKLRGYIEEQPSVITVLLRDEMRSINKISYGQMGS